MNCLIGTDIYTTLTLRVRGLMRTYRTARGTAQPSVDLNGKDIHKRRDVCALCRVAQLCLTLCDTMDCIPPGSSVHGLLQARILEWAAKPSPGEKEMYAYIYS